MDDCDESGPRWDELGRYGTNQERDRTTATNQDRDDESGPREDELRPREDELDRDGTNQDRERTNGAEM